MAIPIIIGGVALAAGMFGAKKGLDAKRNYSAAGELVDRAEHDLNAARDRLNLKKDQVSYGLEQLGILRLETESAQLTKFVCIAREINNVSCAPIEIGGVQVRVDSPDIAAMELSSYKAADLLKDGVGALSSGVLAGVGAGGLASSIGVASTGTAIGTLSGVAATNATLAWLGGGSLATGGMGMAGGMAVLGGAIAGPVIAVMGMSAAKKSERALTEAFERESQIRDAIEQVNNGVTVLCSIHSRAQELEKVIRMLSERFEELLSQGEVMICRRKVDAANIKDAIKVKQKEYEEKNVFMRGLAGLVGGRPKLSFDDPLNFNNFSSQDKSLYMVLARFAYAVNALVRVKILDDDGIVTQDSEQVISDAKKILEGA
ncbi:hypothetical protein HNP55_003768 [Paucibacter oligotrophus]|uniref:Uncharacterized protein n=1 Tax=Roseateles oligotrophus TaxID=1769250 RepID=A0A840LBW3_9BURK|nr:hypothetical protein [Roseateles oligotrophus]MBB4845221.1 hypothetical protein [Roseateles oligotrophus]